jgi:hypothetical protein
MVWCNNYRFNDDPGSCIPQTLLGLPHFPASTSVLMCMVPFAGEVDVPVCICGNCYEGFCDHRGVPGCFIVRPCAHSLVTPPGCGVCRGFSKGDRVILRAPVTDVPLTPYGAGSGVRNAVVYQLFACVERPPTPHTGIVYDKLVLTSPSDVTDALLRDLDFVAESDVVGGALADHSLIFHGVEGEEYGIDAAIVFTSKEPGEEPLIYAYRTLARIRDCEMPHIMRINQDVVRASMQGRSFINQANLLTAQVIRTKFPDVTHVVIEPDSDIGYHRNYTTHGFLWRLQYNLVATEKPPAAVDPGLPCADRTVPAPLPVPVVRGPAQAPPRRTECLSSGRRLRNKITSGGLSACCDLSPQCVSESPHELACDTSRPMFVFNNTDRGVLSDTHSPHTGAVGNGVFGYHCSM